MKSTSATMSISKGASVVLLVRSYAGFPSNNVSILLCIPIAALSQFEPPNSTDIRHLWISPVVPQGDENDVVIPLCGRNGPAAHSTRWTRIGMRLARSGLYMRSAGTYNKAR
jgi:hypothetical protein